MNTLYKFYVLIVWVPLYAFFIFIDRYILSKLPGGNPFIDFPCSIEQAIYPKERMFELLKKKRVIPPYADFISMDVLGGAESEPDKSVVRLNIVYDDVWSDNKSENPWVAALKESKVLKNIRKELKIFVKISTARRISVFMKALKSAYSKVEKEVCFYSTVLPTIKQQIMSQTHAVGFDVPRHKYSGWSRTFDRSILVLEAIDVGKGGEFTCTPDWQGVPPHAIEKIGEKIAHLHSATWKLRGAGEALLAGPRTYFALQTLAERCFEERKGTEWLDGVMQLYISKTTPVQQKMWQVIGKRLAREPACILHGDCRIGNHLHNKDFSKIIFADWEAMHMGCFLWDIVYAMVLSLPVDVRRANERQIIASYLQGLKAAGVEDAPSLEACLDIQKVLHFVILAEGFVLQQFGGVGETQGNTQKDGDSWAEKLFEAIEDSTRDEKDLARILGVDTDFIKQWGVDHRRDNPMAATLHDRHNIRAGNYATDSGEKAPLIG